MSDTAATTTTTTRQQAPFTEHCRPVGELMERVRALCEGAGVPARLYRGTSLSQLSLLCDSALTGTDGAPAAVVCFQGSDFGNHPRRTTHLTVVVLSGDTRPAPGLPDAIAAAQAVEAACDRLVTESIDAGGQPATDLMLVVSEEALELSDAGASCAVAIGIDIQDY